MASLTRDRLLLAWALLVAVTLVSVSAGGSPFAVTATVLGIALAKAGVVMFAFMEVRGAPLALRLLCTVWLAAVFAALLATYAGAFA